MQQRCDEVLATGLANPAFSAQKGLMQKLQAAAAEAADRVSDLIQKQTTCEYLGHKQRDGHETDPSQLKVTSQEKKTCACADMVSMDLSGTERGRRARGAKV